MLKLSLFALAVSLALASPAVAAERTLIGSCPSGQVLRDGVCVSAGTTTTCPGSQVFRDGQCVTELQNPFGQGVTLTTLIGRIIRIFTGVAGTAALIMFVYGGFLWLTSGGNEEKITKGKNIFTWATIGLVIIFLAYAIVSQVFGLLSTV